MPSLSSACQHPGCTATAERYSQTCADHKRERQRTYDKTRASAAARGYDRRWRKARAMYINAHPLCEHCGEPAEEVDHITPIADGGPRLDFRNLQSLCKPCHSRKTRRQNAPPAATAPRGGAVSISEDTPRVDRRGSQKTSVSGFRGGGLDG